MNYQSGPSTGRIAGQYAVDDGNRQEILDRARLCAALTKPWILPPLNQDQQQKLPEPFQSIGQWGTTNLVGAMHQATFPSGAPWFQYALDPMIEFNPNITPESKQKNLNLLQIRQLIIQSLIESTHLDDGEGGNRRAAAFFSRKHFSLTQLAITGDTLEQLLDDYRLKVFRRDSYVTARDSCGDVLYHITSEMIDLMKLTPEQRVKLGVDDGETKTKPVYDRMVPLFTMIEWQPWTKTWVICQEANGTEILESEEKVTPYFSTPYDLSSGENYGRGFVEQNMGDLRSVNELEMRIQDFAALCSDIKLALDHSGCEAQDRDFVKPSGSIIRGLRVQGGKVQDAAYLTMDKYADFKVVGDTVIRKRGDLARSMQIESEITPAKERTTAYQVQRIQAQLQSATGGMFSSIIDEQQIPLIRRLDHKAQKDKYLPKLPPKTVKVNVLTGLAALTKQAKLGSILQFADVVTRLGPEVQARLNPDVLLDVIARYANIYEHGLVRSREEMERMKQQAMKDQVGMVAAQKATDVLGNVAEASLTQAATAA